MRKIVVILCGGFLFLFSPVVLAKDTVYSLNQYDEEEFLFLLRGYQKDKKDGYIAAGTFVETKKGENDTSFQDTQVMVVKYKKNGSVDWDYHYGKTGEDTLFAFFYSYNEEKVRDGYVLLVNEPYELETENLGILHFVKLDFDGEVVEDVVASLPSHIAIHQVIENKNELDEIVGYSFIGSTKENEAYLARFDINLNKVFERVYSEYQTFSEIIDCYPHMMILSQSDSGYHLLRFDFDGNVVKNVKDSFEEYDIPHLLGRGNHYILYGYTDEVKLKQNQDYSYYLDQYDENDEVVWETIGDTAVDIESRLFLRPVIRSGEVEEYHLLYENGVDSSIEIVKIDLEGIIQNKIKKIKNNYYHINSFLSNGTTLYFVGQIHCPEDDNCDFDRNSLFLVSEEDKVIEVKDKDSKNILVVITVFFVMMIGFYFMRKRKKA